VTDALRVILEVGPKRRRSVAGAQDWPGLERWGASEDEAIEKLTAYLPRYGDVAKRAGLAAAFARAGTPKVVERVAGNTSTDWWGVAHVPSKVEAEVLTAKDLDRRLSLLQATWDQFDDAVGHAPAQLPKGPRGGGRDRDEIVRHVYGSERHQWWRKVGIREPEDVRLAPRQLAAIRRRYVDAIRAYNAEGRLALRWPIQFLIRRTAQHAMDHAWEIEDRSP
jgi:hypothetical protein